MLSVSPKGVHPVLATGAVAAALAGWFCWPAEPHSQLASDLVVVEAQHGVVGQTPTIHEKPEAAEPTLDWLLGTWSGSDNGGNAAAPCDLSTVVTFRTGEYFSPRSMGRYALNGDRLLLWNRIFLDADAGENRSHIAGRAIRTLKRLSDTAMLRDGTALFRCDKAANNREQDQ